MSDPQNPGDISAEQYCEILQEKLQAAEARANAAEARADLARHTLTNAISGENEALDRAKELEADNQRLMEIGTEQTMRVEELEADNRSLLIESNRRHDISVSEAIRADAAEERATLATNLCREAQQRSGGEK